MPKPPKKPRPDRRPPSPPPPPAPPPPLRHTGLSFSFRYFVDRPPFEVARGGSGYPITLLERFRDLSPFTALELQANRNQALRCHQIDWPYTTEPSGFIHLNSYFRSQLTPYQFSLSSNAHGRVHGFFIGDVFYVVWLDPEHQLYAR
jgi:hypothetical protein